MVFKDTINILQDVNATLNSIETSLETNRNKKNNEAWKYIDNAYSELNKAIQVLKGNL